jgi:hypothetical protein
VKKKIKTNKINREKVGKPKPVEMEEMFEMSMISVGELGKGDVMHELNPFLAIIIQMLFEMNKTKSEKKEHFKIKEKDRKFKHESSIFSL